MANTVWSVALGVVLGLGLLLVVTPAPLRHSHARRRAWLPDLLAEAGMAGTTPVHVLLASIGLAVVALVVVVGISASLAVGAVFAVLAAGAPVTYLRARARRRRQELRELWPDLIDNLASAVRAGMSLPEALTQVGQRGPAALRPAFRSFDDDYRVSGRFGQSLDVLKNQFADPVGDRIVESLRLAREVGGTDLGRLLRALSTFLRDDLRTRGEIRSRQTWTINAARLAVAAPWVLLALLSLRPRAVAAYDSAAGIAVLTFGAVVSFVAYRIMLRIAALPTEVRVLR